MGSRIISYDDHQELAGLHKHRRSRHSHFPTKLPMANAYSVLQCKHWTQVKWHSSIPGPPHACAAPLAATAASPALSAAAGSPGCPSSGPPPETRIMRLSLTRRRTGSSARLMFQRTRCGIDIAKKVLSVAEQGMLCLGRVTVLLGPCGFLAALHVGSRSVRRSYQVH